MSINLSYDFFANNEGDAHFYYAQCKTNRMRDWKYLFDSPSYEKVLQGVKESQMRVENLMNHADPSQRKYNIKCYKSMKWRIIKVDAELLPL
jgi:hypothetical protein